MIKEEDIAQEQQHDTPDDYDQDQKRQPFTLEEDDDKPVDRAAV